MGKSKKKARRRMTERERILHRALALLAHKALSLDDGEKLTGKKRPTRTDIESAVASMSEGRILRLARLVYKRTDERMTELARKEAETYAQERLALKLLWLCLGGGRSDAPPVPLPEEIPVTYPLDTIYRDTAKLLIQVAGRIDEARSKAERWERYAETIREFSLDVIQKLGRPE